MDVFIINKSQDYNEVETIIGGVREQCFSFNPLILKNSNAFWKIDAKRKIRKSQLVVVFIGEHTHESPYVEWEIRTADRLNKRIVSVLLDPAFAIPPSLVKQNAFSGSDVRIDEQLTPEGLLALVKGYERSDYRVLNGSIEELDRSDLMEQYKIYLQTSEDLVERRQTVNNFYITANAALVSIFGTVVAVSANRDLGLLVGFCFAALGVVLCLSWSRILKSYGNLNASKMKVISIIERELPASLYDAEWSVMSDRLNKQRYVSFTESEKRVPQIFIGIYAVIFLVSVVLWLA